MDDREVERWFAEYLDAVAACGRGERDASSLLAFYGVPLTMATDAGAVALMGEDQVVAAARQQIDGMLATGYDHSDLLESEVTVLNATCALYRGAYSRRRADGSEIGRLTATYLVTEGPDGRRISAMALHTP